MGKATHVPGPWTIRDGDFIDAPDRLNVAHVRGAHLPHEPELQATARLIAAAPDLLAALTLCQSALAMMIAPDAIQSSTVLNAFAQATEAEAKARAAIQKAVA